MVIRSENPSGARRARPSSARARPAAVRRSFTLPITVVAVSRRALAALARVALLPPLACSLTVDAGRSQCQADPDCMTGSSALAAGRCVDGLCEERSEWSCAAGAIGAAAAPPDDVEVALPVVDLLARDRPAELEARLCRKLDVSCEAPTQTMRMDDSGEFRLRLEPGFDGYLSIRGEGLVPTLYFLTPPYSPLGSVERLPALTLVSPALMQALALDMQVALQPERGLALFTIQDCSGAFAPGVTFEAQAIDEATTGFYDFDGLPTVSAALTGRTGSGGFINAPAGPLSVVARLSGGAAAVASGSVLVRPGFVSYGRLLPNASAPDPFADSL